MPIPEQIKLADVEVVIAATGTPGVDGKNFDRLCYVVLLALGIFLDTVAEDMARKK